MNFQNNRKKSQQNFKKTKETNASKVKILMKPLIIIQRVYNINQLYIKAIATELWHILRKNVQILIFQNLKNVYKIVIVQFP